MAKRKAAGPRNLSLAELQLEQQNQQLREKLAECEQALREHLLDKPEPGPVPFTTSACQTPDNTAQYEPARQLGMLEGRANALAEVVNDCFKLMRDVMTP